MRWGFTKGDVNYRHIAIRNLMERRDLLEERTFRGGREIARDLLITNIYCSVHRSLPLGRALGQFNSIHPYRISLRTFFLILSLIYPCVLQVVCSVPAENTHYRRVLHVLMPFVLVWWIVFSHGFHLWSSLFCIFSPASLWRSFHINRFSPADILKNVSRNSLYFTSVVRWYSIHRNTGGRWDEMHR